jgi:AcrR family transcriptional regulator
MANQRARICGAMIEAVAEQGYPAVSVAGLCRLAGVSKRAYYELFANKEACFLATYDGTVGCARARIVRAQRGAGDCEEGLRAAIEALVRAIEERPKAARVACLEALSAGPAASARCARASLELERIIAWSLARAPHAARLRPLLVRGVACGVERVSRLSLLEHRRVDPRALADWALSFGSPALAALPRAAPSLGGPPARSWVPARARKGSERSRILRAAAEIVACAGSSRLTAASIARRAQVREEVVLELYPSTDECFLDALDLVGLEALVSIAEASRGADDGPSGVCRAVGALTDRLAGDPILRSVAFLEVLAPGAAGMDRREHLLRGIGDLIAKPLPLSDSWVVGEATAGALWGLVHHHVASGAAHMLPGFAPQAAYVVLAPLVGAERAVEAIAGEWPEFRALSGSC